MKPTLIVSGGLRPPPSQLAPALQEQGGTMGQNPAQEVRQTVPALVTPPPPGVPPHPPYLSRSNSPLLRCPAHRGFPIGSRGSRTQGAGRGAPASGRGRQLLGVGRRIICAPTHPRPNPLPTPTPPQVRAHSRPKARARTHISLPQYHRPPKPEPCPLPPGPQPTRRALKLQREEPRPWPWSGWDHVCVPSAFPEHARGSPAGPLRTQPPGATRVIPSDFVFSAGSCEHQATEPRLH